MSPDQVLKTLCEIVEGRTIEATFKTATDWFGAIGFSRVNYGYTQYRHAHSIGDPDDALYLSNCSEDYIAEYFHSGFYMRTPLFRWAQNNEGACTWKWVREAYEAGTLTPEECATLAKNAQIGVTAGITVSFHASSSRAKGAIGIIADQGLSEDDVEDIFARQKDAIIAVSNMMHLRILQLPHLGRNRVLSPRQREALEWVADGKTSQDVALLMGVSTAMVEKHLRLAREALSVETTAQAIAKSTALNMIFTRPNAQE